MVCGEQHHDAHAFEDRARAREGRVPRLQQALADVIPKGLIIEDYTRILLSGKRAVGLSDASEPTRNRERGV